MTDLLAAAAGTSHRSGLVRDLAALRSADVDDVGGKAANLGELVAAGFPVPPGFCVTTAAYRLVAPHLDRLADGTPDAAAARTSMLRAPMPQAVEQAVRDAYAQLADGGAPVAVRSSATAEDLPGASFAGQQETYLNVVGADAVVDAVRRCWASLWTERATSYRTAQEVGHDAVALAVVVQVMVDAAVAGVLFTANPVTGRRGEAVVDANPGLGESVVSGAVDPDHFVLDTRTGTVTARTLGAKQHGVWSTPGGGTEQRAAGRPDADSSYCLDDAQLAELVTIGADVERHFGNPQDIEWALDDQGTWWLTQSRPITTLYPIPEPLPHHPVSDPPGYTQPRVLLCVSLMQGLHRPMTPLGLSAFGVFASAALGLAGKPPADRLAGPRGMRVGGDRLFVDATPALQTRVGRALVPRVLDVMETRSAVVVRQLMTDPRFDPPPGRDRPSASPLIRVLVRFRIPLVAAAALISPGRAHRRAHRIAAEMTRRADAVRIGDARARLDAVVSLLSDAVGELPRLVPAPAAGFAALGIAARLLRGVTTRGDLEAVLRSVPDNVTTQMDLALWQVAERVRSDDAAGAALRDGDPADLADRYRSGRLPAVLQRALRTFLDTYGHRAVAEIDLGVPRWADDPTHLLGVLAGYLRLPEQAETPREHFVAGEVQAGRTIDELLQRARQRSRGRALIAGFCLRRARALVGLRELPKFLIIRTMSGARAELRVIASELVAAQRLRAVDDVSMLSIREVGEALDGRDMRDLVLARRAEYDAEMRRRHVPRLLLSDGTDAEASVAAAAPRPDGALAGTAASAGLVTGIARVVRDPARARLEPGEILVAPSTDPGWTPLFLTAGGLVMEMGGANSHGAVVAREYGIPAVVGVPEATRRIATGDTVTVDGSAGVVSVQPAEPGPGSAP